MALDHYRSWQSVVVDFEPGVNVLIGANGLGKTNIVEAVEVLSTGSSHRTSSTMPLIERGANRATIRANVDDGSGQVTTLEATLTTRGANRARLNSGSSLYLRDIIGRVPSVSFTPEDQRLVSGDPAARRIMLNQAGALLEPGYAAAAAQLTKIGKQRAALLKQLGTRDGMPQDATLSGLEIWTGQFIEAGVALTRMRAKVVKLLAEPFAAIYRDLAGQDETATLTYVPSFDEVLAFDDPRSAISEHFQRIYPGEVARGVNLIGPQRDDLSLDLAGMPAREFASNGEMWTMALALKMALFAVVRERLGTTPIVILDDVFAQLDNNRRTQILDFAARQDQVLITAAADGDVPAGQAHRIDVGELRESSLNGNWGMA
nr:DNA replication/repair protein RecF [Bifidobacterium sp. DSM 109957]